MIDNTSEALGERIPEAVWQARTAAPLTPELLDLLQHAINVPTAIPCAWPADQSMSHNELKAHVIWGGCWWCQTAAVLRAQGYHVNERIGRPS